MTRHLPLRILAGLFDEDLFQQSVFNLKARFDEVAPPFDLKKCFFSEFQDSGKMRRPLLPTEAAAAAGLEKICCCDLDQSFSTKPDQNFGGFEIFYDLLSPSLALSSSLSVYTSLALSLSRSLSPSPALFLSSLSLSCSLSHPQKHFIPFLILPLYL